MPATLEELTAERESVRVVLVEDNVADARLVAEMLRDAGDLAVITRCDRLAAAERPVSNGLADLVLLDLGLPDATGLEALHRLRAIAPDVPVVVLSGATDEQLALEAVRSGAQDVLAKGDVEPAALLREIQYAVERQRSERRLARLALRDPLTGLPNRVLFADRLEQTMARGLRRPRAAGGLVLLMLVDVDAFAAVNAAAGHVAGDRLLIELAARLRGALREGDTVARLGGDEYVVLCEDVTDETAALRLGERLAQLAADPSEAEPGLTISASIGVAVVEPGTESGPELLLRADEAVHAAKRIGPGRCSMADPPRPVR